MDTALFISPGTILALIQNPEGEQDRDHFFQIIEIKDNIKNEDYPKFSTISDGHQCIVSSFKKTEDNVYPKKYDVINIKSFEVNEGKSSKMLAIINFEIVATDLKEIVGQVSKDNALIPPPLNKQYYIPNHAQYQGKYKGSLQTTKSKAPEKPTGYKSENLYRSLKSLSLFQNSWTIKARVIRRAEVRNFKNQKGEGKLIAIDLKDYEGTEISATLFGEAVDKYDSILKQGNVYLFQNGNVKSANEKFNKVKNVMCLIFDKLSIITPVEDDPEIQSTKIEWLTISKISNLTVNSFVNVMGMVINIQEISQVSTSNGLCDKRNIEI